MMTFLNLLNALIQKSHCHILPNFGSGSPPGHKGSVSVGLGGGASIEPLAGGGGGGVAQGLGIGLYAFGGAYWPLATAHSDPLWARTCFGCVNGAPG